MEPALLLHSIYAIFSYIIGYHNYIFSNNWKLYGSVDGNEMQLKMKLLFWILDF